MRSSHEEKIYDHTLLLHQVHQWRADGHTIVFTNGCFDLFHPGHLHLLTQASACGDKLIVAINDDNSVAQLKAGRPVIPAFWRIRIVAALGLVDAVTMFDTATPLPLIQSIRPDVLVKGGDYRADEVVGRDVVVSYGGRVALIPLLPGYSTTALIDRLRQG